MTHPRISPNCELQEVLISKIQIRLKFPPDGIQRKLDPLSIPTHVCSTRKGQLSQYSAQTQQTSAPMTIFTGESTTLLLLKLPAVCMLEQSLKLLYAANSSSFNQMDENFIKKCWRPSEVSPTKRACLSLHFHPQKHKLRGSHQSSQQQRHQGRLGDALANPRPILQVCQHRPRAQSTTIIVAEEDQQ